MARPQIELDAKLVQELANAQLTTPEIARICGCSEDTLERRFAGSLKEWKDEGVGSVRRELFATAMGNSKGKVSAMIFFLKNYGGMSDNLKVGGEITHNYVDLSHLSDEQLSELERLVESAEAQNQP